MRNLIIFLVTIFSFLDVFSQAGPLLPAPPASLTGSQISLQNKIKLNWLAPGGTFNGYKIYYQYGANPIKTAKIGKVISDTLENLFYNETYKVFLKSYKLGSTPGDTLYSPSTDTLNINVVGLIAPKVKPESAQNSPTSILFVLEDTNPFETGLQVEVTETGTSNVKTESYPPGTNEIKSVIGLKPKTLYSFRARAVYNSQFGPWSELVYSKTLVDNPPAATLSYDKNCPDIVHINWSIKNRPEDVELIILHKSNDNLNFKEINRFPPNISEYYDSDVNPGVTVFYRIVTYNSTNTTPSLSISVTPKTYVNPKPVLGLISDSKAKSNTFLTFRWTNQQEDIECRTDKVSEVIVMYKKAGDPTYSEAGRFPPLTSSIKISGLNPRTAYNVGVIILSDKGLFSNMVTTVDTTFGPPFPPVNLAIVSTVNALGTPNNGLNWKYNYFDHDYVKIERSTGTGPFIEIAKIKSSYNYFVDMNIEEGVMYSYRVTAGNFIYGDGLPSEVNGPRIFQYTKTPNAPVGLVAKVTGSKVGLTWIDDSIREENQILEKSGDNGTSFTIVATLARNITSYSDENVLSGKNYLYRIKAVNSVGESPYSKTTEAKIPTSGLINNNTIGITVFPNPTVNDIKIEYSKNLIGENISVKVYDKMNRIVQTQTFKGNTSTVHEFSFSKLLPGLYNVVISTDGGTISKKVVKF
ncbi:MAG: T9SS type A sorting domain-containing protein [Cytophagaceae bacterium]|nr:T9SS type A sorting domain-containing protein [Cytophagaceae bacterium]MBK9934332.1 T9SS type A sorting domain-containing protein [Cytophagaceae bacterium]MBL0300780.1 T9SS type A sorting domain-containing protein [Cytophagaceae bacterium]MBL0327724.1 T9SS type A sorting domain-containing protein [Cytophagaceae bacterium]